MPDRTCATDDSGDRGPGDGGYFASLAPAGQLRLTTFPRDGIPVSASVRGVVDGDRAYFRVWNRSGTVHRLRHTDAVQVTRCGVLGFTYGPPLDATTRPLSERETSLVAGLLDCGSPRWRRLLNWLLRRRTVCFELLADEAGPAQGGLSEGFSSSLIIRVHTSRGFIRSGAVTPTSLATVCAQSMMAHPCPPGYTQLTTVSMSWSGPRPASESRAAHEAVPAPAAHAGNILPSERRPTATS
jgi:PPOX class probable F420-dependent enzyme